jgi:hypothetical protein
MILYLIGFICIAAIMICIRVFLFPAREEQPIPYSLKKSDLYEDGNRLLYMYDGQYYEAISIKDEFVLIYDKTHDRVIKVPYIEG